MQWLTALLAFAVTMLMFAIVVSTLVEMIHRIMNMRAKGLQMMLENLYVRVILPKLVAPGGDRTKLLSAKDFAALMMENRAAVTKGEPPEGIVSGILRRFVDWAVVTNIPTEIFTQKLADGRLVGAGDNFADDVVKDIAQKYEAFGKEVSLYFESRARLLSVIVAFFVAWMFYVHPYKLAVTYFKNPEVAQAIADKAAETHAKYVALTEALNAARAEVDKEEGTDELRAAVDELKTTLGEVKAENENLQKLGVPVGWVDLKDCNAEAGSAGSAGSVGSVDCGAHFLGATIPIPSFVNAFWLIVGGLLVGLGAPFWAQAVASLTASRDVTRRIAEIVTPERTVQNQAPAAPAGPGAAVEATSVATFKVSRTASAKNVR